MSEDVRVADGVTFRATLLLCRQDGDRYLRTRRVVAALGTSKRPRVRVTIGG